MIYSIGMFPALWAGNMPMEKEGEFHSAEGYAAFIRRAACPGPFGIPPQGARAGETSPALPVVGQKQSGGKALTLYHRCLAEPTGFEPAI
ncbi:MAG TPA: hypothetical protein VFS21_08960 [Roseiflexaceae bacterium]|nr:hypothetical protein [Roseiflexaceae bacterium]